MNDPFVCLFLFGVMGLTAISIYDFRKGRYSAKSIVVSAGNRITKVLSAVLIVLMIIALEYIDNQMVTVGLYGIMITVAMLVLTAYQIIHYKKTKEEVFLWRIGALDVCAILLFLLIIKDLPKMIR